MFSVSSSSFGSYLQGDGRHQRTVGLGLVQLGHRHALHLLRSLSRFLHNSELTSTVIRQLQDWDTLSDSRVVKLFLTQESGKITIHLRDRRWVTASDSNAYSLRDLRLRYRHL